MLRVFPIHDAKRWMDYLSKTGPFELRHYPTELVVVAKSLDPREQFINEPIAHVRHTLFGIPCPKRLQICHSGFGEANGNLGHFRLVEAELRLCIR